MSLVTLQMQPVALAASAGAPRGIGSAMKGGDAAASAAGTGRSSAWRSGLAVPNRIVTFGAVSRTFGARRAIGLGAKVPA